MLLVAEQDLLPQHQHLLTLVQLLQHQQIPIRELATHLQVGVMEQISMLQVQRIHVQDLSLAM
jgi:hypothetical protein